MSHLTVLMAPVEAVGHISACVGIGQQLLTRGHRVVFATPNSFRNQLRPMGFDELYFQDEAEESMDLGQVVTQMAPVLRLSSILKMELFNFAMYQEGIKKTKESHDKMLEIVQTLKPDVILVDNGFHAPALMNQGIPWVNACSLSPLKNMVSSELPPGFSGYEVSPRNTELWEEFVTKQRSVYSDLWTEFQTWLDQHGGPTLPSEAMETCWQEFSPYANIYMFPAEMSYEIEDKALDRSKWFGFDAFVRQESGTFEIPEELKEFNGKLIYFSMGTLGSSELVLMRRLIGTLAKSPNRFVVSKGPLGNQLTLAGNMWGENTVKQTLVLPLVDLVITHGGNNTVTESFYYGKPLIVLPLFVDQLDNAARVQETGHGLRFDPYAVTESELLNGIEQLLGNELLKRRMNSIGVRIRGSNCQSKAADVVERVGRENRNGGTGKPKK